MSLLHIYVKYTYEGNKNDTSTTIIIIEGRVVFFFRSDIVKFDSKNQDDDELLTIFLENYLKFGGIKRVNL